MRLRGLGAGVSRPGGSHPFCRGCVPVDTAEAADSGILSSSGTEGAKSPERLGPAAARPRAFRIRKGGGPAAAMILASFVACGNPGVQSGPASPGSKAPVTEATQPGNSSTPAPPLIRSDYQPGEIARLCALAMEQASQRLSAIAGTKPGERKLDNTLLALEEANADLSDATTPLAFMGYVSPVPAIAREGAECESKVSQFSVSTFTRKDLYEAIVAGAAADKPRDAAEARLLSETLKDFEDKGLRLPDARLQEVRDKEQALARLEARFTANLNQDAPSVEFARKELVGVPADEMARLRKAPGGRLVVTLSEPDYFAIEDNATLESTRRRVFSAFSNRVADKNVPLLESAIELRGKIATLLGYKTWADYRTHRGMARDSDSVMAFLYSLRDRLLKPERAELAMLLTLKKRLDPGATRVRPWDVRYLTHQYVKSRFRLDDETVREYFPADTVVHGLFEVYSELLGVRFVKVPGAPTWADRVDLYEIRDGSDGRLIGYFYTDFYPREHKFGHAAAFPLRLGRRAPDGRGYSTPVSAIVANFSPPLGGKPSLLGMDEVITLFHEFGHVMHQTLTRAPYGSLSGSAVERDFVEAPSQMLENWPWQPEVLKRISGFYLDPSRKIPDDLLARMIAARAFRGNCPVAFFYMRQLMLALTDMIYHTSPGPVDTTGVYNRLYRSLLGIDPGDGNHFQASWGQLMEGYDAGYYGYLWSEVYAADLFSVFREKGPLDRVTGARYRRSILEVGRMRDAGDSLREFLGRAPGDDAFFRQLRDQIDAVGEGGG